MTAKEIINQSLTVYKQHCAGKIVEKRKLMKGVPEKEQLEKIEEARSVWKSRFQETELLMNRINKGELLGL